jgi:hypothetical protein
MRPELEVADIFRRHGPAYRQAYADHLGGTECRVMAAIEACRTPALGGHVALVTLARRAPSQDRNGWKPA